VNPFFFGSTRRPLFGVYHAPQTRPVRETGIVLCAPAGHEYARTHRVLRHLALTLASAGCHVLRFDWYGVGDSGGDGSDADLRGWIADAGAAIEELKDTAGVSRVSLVGIRLGGAIAVSAAAKRRDIDHVVLWDPVVDGRSYLRELTTLHHAFLANEYPPPRGADEDDALLGHPLSAALRDQLEALRLTSLRTCGARAVHLVMSRDTAELEQFRVHLGTLPVRSTHRFLAAPADWDAVDRIVAALLPQQVQPVLQGIEALVTAGAA
jgi:pimeloyl-ACP methyl ester carboxylesterase